MKTILIADSGSTKSDWALVATSRGTTRRFTTQGMNPFFQSSEEMAETLRKVHEVVRAELPEGEWLDVVSFYGAGCTAPKIPAVREVLESVFSPGSVEIESDLLGAARALCGREEGIACILGTGSNSCHYDGSVITANISPLGFILGDEGSGASLGKLLIGDLLKNQLPPALYEEFLLRYSLTPAEIIERVYRAPFPNRFLAGFSPFLHAHLHEASIQQLVTGAFASFFRRNVMQYSCCETTPVHLTGSVAYFYQDTIRKVADSLQLSLGTITRSPMEGLIAFHCR